MVRVFLSRIAPADLRQAPSGTCRRIWPDAVSCRMRVRRIGADWAPVVDEIHGVYARVPRLLADQADITSATIPGLVTADTYAAVIADLQAPGRPGRHVSRAGLVAHDAQTILRYRRALGRTAGQIAAVFSALRVPDAEGMTAAEARAALQADPAHAEAVAAAMILWGRACDALVRHDHTGAAPCEKAYHGVVGPLVRQIRALALRNGWAAPVTDVGASAPVPIRQRRQGPALPLCDDWPASPPRRAG